MDERSTSLLALTDPRPGVQRTIPQLQSQPLRAIDEEGEDESLAPLPNDHHTFPYTASHTAPSVISLTEALYAGENTDDQANVVNFFTVNDEIVLSLSSHSPTGHPTQSSGRLWSRFRSSAPPSSMPSLSRTMSRVSLASVVSRDTFLGRDSNQLDPTISLSSLLDVIARHRSLQDARIVRADSYQQFNGRVVHRFIILELERDGRQKIWLRIDRRRDESAGLLSFVTNGAKAPSDDRAWLSADKHLMSEGLDPEHTTLFEGVVPTLGNLRWVFLAIVQVLKRYELFGANCWFMVSFIYECLDEIFHSSAMARFLYLQKGSEQVRREIRMAARFIITFPFEEVPSHLIEQHGGIEKFYYAMLGHHIDISDATVTSLACAFPKFRNTIPDWLLSQIFVRFSDHNPLNKNPRHVKRIISQLTRVFHGRMLNADAPPLQRSFEIFLRDSFPVLSLPAKIDLPIIHHLHITICLEIMAKELCFNISESPSSFFRNKEMLNQEALEGVNISSHLRYACCHWADQMSQLETVNTDLSEMVSRFFHTHFLPWLEVMSILALLPLDVLNKLVAIHLSPLSEDLTNMIKEARQFVELFEVPILESVPHIYISALTFTPSSSKLFSHIRQSFSRTAVAQSGAPSNWLAVSPIIHVAPGRAVLYLAFSPDGCFIVSGSTNNTLQLWDAATGDAIGEPLSGHEGWVQSVAFSPDSTRIASASDDQTIRLWDVATRRQIGQPLKGHTNYVVLIAFSPDGTQLVSASFDNTVCRWDAGSGRMIGEPLRGHSDVVRSVAISPDGMRIASASDDRTIRIWDSKTGEPIGKPLEGHSGVVWCVVFAPDGIQIASASDDRTVRRWDGKTGEPIGKPSEAHAGPVYCVAYSPDSRWIASGLSDKTVRLWDARTGEAVGKSLSGHSALVGTVAFSPNGCTIASGSYDGTIRLWQCSTSGLDNESQLPLPHPSITQSSRPVQKVTPVNSSFSTPQQLPSSNLPPCEALQLREDGWITGPNNELVLWLPLGLQVNMPFSEWAGIDNINFTNFRCGAEWSNCWRGSGEAQAA